MQNALFVKYASRARVYDFWSGLWWLPHRPIRRIALNFIPRLISTEFHVMYFMFLAWPFFKTEIIRWQYCAPSAWLADFRSIDYIWSISVYSESHIHTSIENRNIYYFLLSQFSVFYFCCWSRYIIMGNNTNLHVQSWCKNHGTSVNCGITLHSNGTVKRLGPHERGNFTPRADLAGPGVWLSLSILKINHWMSLTKEGLTVLCYTYSPAVFGSCYRSYCDRNKSIRKPLR